MTQNKNGLILLFVLIGAIIISPLLWWRPWTGFPHGMMGMTGYGWWFAPIVSIGFLALLAAGAYYFITGFTRTPTANERPLEILKERYAKGEISREQYLKMKEELES